MNSQQRSIIHVARHHVFVIVLYVICLLMISSFSFSEEILSPEKILTNTLKSQQNSDVIQAKVSVTWVNKRVSPQFYSPPDQQYVFEFSRDHHKINIIGKNLVSGKDNEISYRFRWTFDGEVATDYNIYYTKGETTPTGGIASSNVNLSRLRFLFPIEHGNFLDGYLQGFTDHQGRRAVELMLESSTLKLLGKEIIDNHECFVITAKIPNGTITQWIDPATDYYPRKIEWVKGPKDIYETGESLKSEGRYLFLKTTIDKFDFIKTESGFLPVKATYHEMTDGIKEEDTFYIHAECSRKDVNLSPNFSPEVFKTDYPEEVTITNLDDPQSGVLYLIKDGKIVTGYDSFEGNAEGRWNSHWYLRSLLTILGSLMIIGAFGIMLWKKYIKSS